MRQFYNKAHTRVLRVQQSMADCMYRVVSIPASDVDRSFGGSYTVPKWAVKWRYPESALAQLLEYAARYNLEKYEKAASSVGAE